MRWAGTGGLWSSGRLRMKLAPQSTLFSLLLATWVAGALPACTPPVRVGDTGMGGSTGSGSGGAPTGSGGAQPGSGGAQPGSGGTTASGGSSASKGGTGGGAGGSGGTVVTTGGTGGTSSGGSSGGGTGGNANTGGAAGAPLSRGPTPPANGANFPFPQNRQMSGCIYPTAYDNNDVMAAYTKWKADVVVSDAGAGGFQRVQRTSSDGVSAATPAGSTVSEGIGYGMLIAVYMGDHTLFDNLWKYEQLHLDANGLMNWSITSAGTNTPMEAGGATDADEDMAYALIMADKQWGGMGSLSKTYSAYALSEIQAIWNHEVYNSNLAGPGDSWGPTDLTKDINISYFAPAYYRLFKQLDSSHNWDAVTQTVYDTIFGPNSSTPGALNATNKNTANGLVPGWCTSTGGSSSAGPFNYQYDACRTPFRIGVDWCLNGVSASAAATPINPSRAQSYVALTSSFFSGVGAANIVDGYNMDGTINSSAHTVAQGQSAAFVGPAAVGEMSNASNQTFLNAAYNLVKTDTLLVGGAYYDESWTVMSLLMMTGNFLDYTQITPATN